jgi:hypothetical protein
MNQITKPSLVFLVFMSSVCLAYGESGRLATLGTRATCQTGDAVLVDEFILQGAGTETVLMRAIGPSLSHSLTGALRDSTALLLNRRGRTFDSNDNWMDNPDKDQILATGLAPTDPREAALIDSLAPGAYTFVEQGVRGKTGIALPEIYDLADGGLQLSAVGTRGPIFTGDDIMISGFILSGSGPTSLLIRALGPSLADAGLSGVLPNPYLEVLDSSGSLAAANNNWRDTQEQEILATGLAPRDDLESAILVTLDPGAYTLLFSDADGSAGLGFLQVYSLALPVRELNPAPIIPK